MEKAWQEWPEIWHVDIFYGMKFGVLVYPDHLQNLLYFGRGLDFPYFGGIIFLVRVFWFSNFIMSIQRLLASPQLAFGDLVVLQLFNP